MVNGWQWSCKYQQPSSAAATKTAKTCNANYFRVGLLCAGAIHFVMIISTNFHQILNFVALLIVFIVEVLKCKRLWLKVLSALNAPFPSASILFFLSFSLVLSVCFWHFPTISTPFSLYNLLKLLHSFFSSAVILCNMQFHGIFSIDKHLSFASSRKQTRMRDNNIDEKKASRAAF